MEAAVRQFSDQEAALVAAEDSVAVATSAGEEVQLEASNSGLLIQKVQGVATLAQLDVNDANGEQQLNGSTQLFRT